MMAFHLTVNSVFISRLRTLFHLMVFCSITKGQLCKDSEFIEEKPNSYLQNHAKETFRTETATLCRVMCYLDGVCMSYNYHESSGHCEVNDSDHLQYLVDLISKTGYSYVRRKNVCENKPCPSNAICKADFHKGGFECLPAALGSRERPAKSCLDILINGFSIGSGVYVLDPANTGNPIKAYCDMTTDGGGWTKVKRLYLETTRNLTNKAYHSYEVLAQYNNNNETVILTTNAMLDIYKTIGFNQIHFYCYKKSVGRVVSIMTKNNTAGHEVVKFFINTPVSDFPTACGSFDPLPEDTSILAQNCSLWGKQKSNTRVNKWGSSKHPKQKRINNYPFGIEGKNGNKAILFSFSKGYWCDDDSSRKDINDTWQISVR